MKRFHKMAERRIRAYMRCNVTEICVLRHGKKAVVYVEYEDFKPEAEVRAYIQTLCPPGWLVSVKRECSDEAAKEILLHMLRSDVRNRGRMLEGSLTNRFLEWFECRTFNH